MASLLTQHHALPSACDPLASWHLQVSKGKVGPGPQDSVSGSAETG